LGQPNLAQTSPNPYFSGRPQPYSYFTNVTVDNNTTLSFIYNYALIAPTIRDAGVCGTLCLLDALCHYVVSGIGSCLYGNFQPSYAIPGFTATSANTTASINQGAVPLNGGAPVLLDGLDQSLFYLYFCLKQIHRMFFKMVSMVIG
jgi:hypothetical protein